LQTILSALIIPYNDPNYNRIPKETEIVGTQKIKGANQIAQYLLLFEMQGGSGLENWIDPDYQTTRLNLRLKDTSNQELAKLIDQIKAYTTIHFPNVSPLKKEDIKITYSNYYIWLAMTQLIIKSQINSLLAVVLTIFLLLSGLFRSFKAGLVTTLPIFIAILFNFTVMRFFGITLNTGTSIIASVSMGIGIDYAIHYYARFRKILNKEKQINKALIIACQRTAGAIFSNAAAVGIGMFVLTFSEYHIIASVGWITSLSMLTTAIASITLLPALASLFKST